MSTKNKIDEMLELFKHQDYDKSIVMCQEILKVNNNPEDISTVLSYLSLCVMKTNKHEEAIPYLTEAISRDHTRFFLWTFRGDCNYQLGFYEKAYSDYWTSLQLEENGAIYDNCARALFLSGNAPYALIMMNKALDMEESPEPVLVMAEMLKRMGFQEGATQVIKRGREKFPNDSRFIPS